MPVQKAACESLEYNNGTHLVKTGSLVTINNELENNAIRNVRFRDNLLTIHSRNVYVHGAKHQ